MSESIRNDLNIDDIFIDFECLNIKPNEIRNNFDTTNSKQLSILNLNIRSLTNKFALLLSLLKLINHDFTIIVITETWLNDSDNALFSIPGYEHISQNRINGEGGGIRIYFHKSIKLISLDNALTGIFPSHESLSCFLSVDKDTQVHITGLYRPPNKSIKEFNSYLKNNLLRQINNSSNTIEIIAGDMNIPFKTDVIYNNSSYLE